VTPRPLARAAAVAAAVLALAACGKRANPVAPQIRIPRVVDDLAATARENAIELAWTVPRRRVDGSPLFDLAVARLYRTDDAGTGEPRAALRVGDRIPGYTEIARFQLTPPAAPEVHGSRIAYPDRHDLAFGRRYTYVVTTADAEGRTSVPSARVSVRYIAPPEAPAALSVVPGDGEVRLTWQPPPRLVDGSAVIGTLSYEVLRSPEPPTEPAVIGRTEAETAYVDRGLVNDHTYQYAVRAIRTAGGARIIGAATPPVAATPAKTTPPAAPSDLVAIPSRGEVRLSWKASTSPDVGLYVVYRAAPGGPFTRVGSARVPATTFVDRDVPPGRYRYAITAQDTSLHANESARSNEVTVAVP
jgi:hypothetical protein